VNFSLFEVDGVDFRTDASPAAGDAKIMKDEGALTTTTRAFTDEGATYAQSLTTTEVTAKRISLEIVDLTGTKAWLDRQIIIETYGHASSQHPNIGATTVQVGASSKTGYSLAAGSLTSGTFAAGAINAAAISGSAGTELGNASWASGTRVLTANTNLNDVTTTQVRAVSLDANQDYDGPTNAEMNARTLVAADYFSPSADTVHLGASALADVQGEVTTALNTYDGPTNTEMNARTLVAADYFDPSADTIQVGATSKTGYTLAAGSLASNTLAAGAINAAALSSTAGAKIADISARRTLANIESSSDGDSLSLRSGYGAHCKMVNKVAISGDTLSVYRTNDSTVLGTQAVTTDVNANPITAVDTN
jgi:hypothetical protein